jgi:hypothetical protein
MCGASRHPFILNHCPERYRKMFNNNNLSQLDRSGTWFAFQKGEL